MRPADLDAVEHIGSHKGSWFLRARSAAPDPSPAPPLPGPVGGFAEGGPALSPRSDGEGGGRAVR
jgi:hypothetical protein